MADVLILSSKLLPLRKFFITFRCIMELKKASPVGRGGGVADGEGNTCPLTRYRGSSPRGRALCDVQLYGCEIHVISAIVIPREVTLIGREIRVVVPNFSRQYLSVCRRDFPMQGDVAPKVWDCSKTFMNQTIEGAHCSHTLGRTSIPFVIKVLEFLKPFFKRF